MKMIIAIVHKEDENKVVNELHKNGFGVTKLCSTGSFLKAGNTTLLVGIEDNQVDDVMAIIEKKSKSRKEYISSSLNPSIMGGMFDSNPVEIMVGGATVFVLNVERMERL